MPDQVLAEADRLAREWGRSRSWVVAEAIRRLSRTRPLPAGSIGTTLGKGQQEPRPTPPGSGARWELLICFDRTGDFLAWREARAGEVDSGDGADEARIRTSLDQERAHYDVPPDPGRPDGGIPELVLLIDPAVENIRRVLRGLAGAGYGFAREELAEAIAGHAVTVIGTAPTVALIPGREALSPGAATSPRGPRHPAPPGWPGPAR